MTDPNKIFTVKCANPDCDSVLSTQDQHSTPFEFLDHARSLGWLVPLLVDNKPIVCPKCHKKP